MLVRATQDGFYDGSRRRKGSVFSLGEGHKLGKWMEVVETKAAKAEKPAKVEKPAKEDKAAAKADDLA